MNKTIIYSIAVIILVITTSSLSAQVTFRMKRPPLNQLKSADLWNATTMNTGESFTAYLYGLMTNNENRKLIAAGQTMPLVDETNFTAYEAEIYTIYGIKGKDTLIKPKISEGYTIDFLENSKLIIKAETDKEGNFTLPELPDGVYKIGILIKNPEPFNDPKLSKESEVIMMTIGEVGFILPLGTRESVELIVGDNQKICADCFYLNKKPKHRPHNYKGTVTLVR